ncbi:hypothetical protein [Lacrimispora brassicae]
MKYNTLRDYEAFLKKGMAASSAISYRKCVDTLLNDQYIMDCKNIDFDLILHKFEAMKHKNQYSKYKSALLKFCEFQDIKLDNDFLLKLNLMKLDKKKQRRKLKEVDLKDINNHMRVIRDKKLKLSYQTMLNKGLRVSELSQIGKDDCVIDSDKIEMSFIGKGGNLESVIILKNENETLYQNLSLLIHDSNDKVFYSANYLQMNANGFACHDLRRAFAKLEYEKNKSLNQTAEKLRHKNKNNTKIYTNSKVKIK